MSCPNCGVAYRPAPARFDGEPTFVGFLPHDCAVRNETGRANAEASAPPVDEPGASPASPSVKDNYPRPMGATPYTPVVTDPLEAIREAEGYVVAEVVGDVDGQPEVRYEGVWRCYLAQGGA